MCKGSKKIGKVGMEGKGDYDKLLGAADVGVKKTAASIRKGRGM